MPWLWVCQEDPQTPGFNGTIGGGGNYDGEQPAREEGGGFCA